MVQNKQKEAGFKKVFASPTSNVGFMTDSLLQIYIEFPKFAQTSYDGMSLQEKFYTAMRDMHEWERRPEQYMDKELDWLFRHADYNNLSESDKEKYEAEMTTKEDYEGYARQRLEWAYEDGHAAGEAKGRAEGLAEGQSKRNIEIARSLKGEGVSVAIISKTTGISAEEIESL